MSDRTAWLSLTQEEALGPDLPICDPHHHLWDLPGSRYLLEEFQNDIGGGHQIVSTVFVECLQKYRVNGPEVLKPVGETEFIEQLAKEQTENGTSIAGGIVGFANLALGTGVKATLEAHMGASRRFRGIRHATAWHESEKIHNAHTHPPEGLLLHKSFREGFAYLEELNLSFDAWLFHPQINELTALAHAFPKVNIILNHMAGPLGIGPYSGRRDEVFVEWRNELKSLASCKNVFLKLGGRAMTMSGFGWHKLEKPPGSIELAKAMAPYFHACIDLFGSDRCMFESNFPVDRASCSYTVLWNAFKRVAHDYSDSECAALLHDTATKVYRLG